MVATLNSSANPRLGDASEERFLTMLPLIRREAVRAFVRSTPDRRNEAIHEVIAAAYVAYARLVAQGRGELAYATPLARFAIRRYRAGRRVGRRQAGNDVMSAYAQRVNGIVVESLSGPEAASEELRETIVEDRKAGPAEVAAARIDVAEWLARLPLKLRQIALMLATGASTTEAAERFQLSPGRISQLRHWLQQNWNQYQPLALA